VSAHEAHGNVSGRFTIGWAIALAAPLLWMVVALLHPAEPQDSGRWVFVHYAQLVLTPFLAFAVWNLLDGIRSTAATISRIALAVWMVFFSAYDATAGLATGLLARHADSLSGAEQTAVNSAADWLLNDGLLPGGAIWLAAVPTIAWPTTVIAAAVALHQAGARLAVAVCLVLSSLFLGHASYPAAIGLAFFVAAEVLWMRQLGAGRERQFPVTA
jgi:hypothetical protein